MSGREVEEPRAAAGTEVGSVSGKRHKHELDGSKKSRGVRGCAACVCVVIMTRGFLFIATSLSCKRRWRVRRRRRHPTTRPRRPRSPWARRHHLAPGPHTRPAPPDASAAAASASSAPAECHRIVLLSKTTIHASSSQLKSTHVNSSSQLN